MMEFLEIDGEAPDKESTCRGYAEKVRSADPQLCLLGVGENGHLAFNHPTMTDFQDTSDVKIVHLDEVCRNQQVKDGWFASVDQVSERVIAQTISALFCVPQLSVSVLTKSKAHSVRRILEDPLSTDCPATILRTHPNVAMYWDPTSADERDEVLATH